MRSGLEEALAAKLEGETHLQSSTLSKLLERLADLSDEITSREKDEGAKAGNDTGSEGLRRR